MDHGKSTLAVLGWVRRAEAGGAAPCAEPALEAGAVARGDFRFHPQTLESIELEILRLASQSGGAFRPWPAGCWASWSRPVPKDWNR